MAKRRVSVLLALLLVLVVVASALAAAQAGGLGIQRWTLDNGGGVSAAGRYSLAGTIGQPDAGVKMTGAGYGLTGGYWGVISPRRLFLPLVQREW